METVLTILNKTTAFFEKYELENPRLDAELLVADALKCSRMQLYLQFERPLSEEILASLRPLLKRRAQREPLQYIIGNTSFMDFDVKTDKRALIPRPETEELIELIQEDFGNTHPLNILDLGTGTGAIACALARIFPESKVTATDIASDTLELTRTNITDLSLQGRITCVQSDWFEAVEGKFDLIVSNPPYLSDEELEAVAPELLNFEPHRALTSGPKGTEAIEVLLKEFGDYLQPDGRLYIETGCDQATQIHEIANELGLGDRVDLLNDLNQKQRFVRVR